MVGDKERGPENWKDDTEAREDGARAMGVTGHGGLRGHRWLKGPRGLRDLKGSGRR